MAQNVACWALNAQAGSPAYTAEMIRATSHMMLTPAPPGKPLGCFSGVRPGTPSNTVTVSGTKVTVKPHAGMIDAGSTSPCYSYAVLDPVVLKLTTPHATYPRNDIIYIAIDDPSRGDGSSAPKAEIRVATGTPATYPKDPAISGSCILQLARIKMPAQGSGAGSATWLARDLNPATNVDQVLAALTELGVPAPYSSKSAIEASNPTKVGALAKDLSTGWVWAWNGSTWKIWEALDATSQLSWAPGASSRHSERAVKCVVRSGVAMLSADLTKRGAWSYSYWSTEKIYTLGAGITTVASCIGQVIWFSDMWVSASNGLIFLQTHGQGTTPDGEYYSIKVSWPTI